MLSHYLRAVSVPRHNCTLNWNYHHGYCYHFYGAPKPGRFALLPFIILRLYCTIASRRVVRAGICLPWHSARGVDRAHGSSAAGRRAVRPTRQYNVHYEAAARSSVHDPGRDARQEYRGVHDDDTLWPSRHRVITYVLHDVSRRDVLVSVCTGYCDFRK